MAGVGVGIEGDFYLSGDGAAGKRDGQFLNICGTIWLELGDIVSIRWSSVDFGANTYLTLVRHVSFHNSRKPLIIMNIISSQFIWLSRSKRIMTCIYLPKRVYLYLNAHCSASSIAAPAQKRTVGGLSTAA